MIKPKQARSQIAHGKSVVELSLEVLALTKEVAELKAEMMKWYDANQPLCDVIKERDHWREMAEKLAVALKKILDEVGTSTLANKIAKEALAEFEAGESAAPVDGQLVQSESFWALSLLNFFK